jgi:hypothetical protein
LGFLREDCGVLVVLDLSRVRRVPARALLSFFSLVSLAPVPGSLSACSSFPSSFSFAFGFSFFTLALSFSLAWSASSFFRRVRRVVGAGVLGAWLDAAVVAEARRVRVSLTSRPSFSFSGAGSVLL